jgi:hypothetical protein
MGDPFLLTLGGIPVCLPAVRPSGLCVACVSCSGEHACVITCVETVNELIDEVGVDPTIYVQGRGTQAPFGVE